MYVTDPAIEEQAIDRAHRFGVRHSPTEATVDD